MSVWKSAHAIDYVLVALSLVMLGFCLGVVVSVFQ
jgi:hypothetical protein